MSSISRHFICFLAILGSCHNDSKPCLVNITHPSHVVTLKTEAAKLRLYLAQHKNFQGDFAFLINMNQPSNTYRFYVYDLNNEIVKDSGLVAHGIGSETGIPGKLTFSNQPNSYCTSLGLYKIGGSYTGRFGKSYTLYGLEKTNNNALARHVVLHAYWEVPEKPTKSPICNSLGCPMVSKGFYSHIEKEIDNRKKPILLSIFY